MQIKYRIGIMPGPWPAGSPGEGVDFFWRLIDVCERTEIDSIWFSDRLSSPLPVLEPMTTMAAVAARTRRLKFGPSVLIAPFRSPVLAARQLAMLDYLSGGRVLPAVGIGVEQEREFLAAGVPFRERGRRTDEAIQVMRRCWEEPEVTFAGEFWRLDRAPLHSARAGRCADARRLHRVRTGRARQRATRAVRPGRRLEVRATTDVPARADARAARAARRRRDPGLPRPLSFGAAGCRLSGPGGSRSRGPGRRCRPRSRHRRAPRERACRPRPRRRRPRRSARRSRGPGAP